MSDRNVNFEEEEVVRTLQSSLERELSELRSLHEAQADELHEAFSPGVINLLRQLSEDDTFFQYPTTDDSSSSSDATSQSPPASDHWKATRMTFKFLCDEFMPAPKDQQMGRFQAFLEQVRGTASRIRLPGGSSLSPDRNATLRQCVTAAKTMKEVLGSKFASLQKYVRMQMEQGQGSRSFAGAHHTADSHIVYGFPTGMDPTGVPQRESASFAGAYHTAGSHIVYGIPTGMDPTGVPQKESASFAGAYHTAGAHQTPGSHIVYGFPTGMDPTDVPQRESASFAGAHHTAGAHQSAGAHHTAGSHIVYGFPTGRDPTDIPQRESASFAGAHQHSPIVPGSLQGFATGMNPSGVPQRDPASGARHESIFRFSGASNPDVSRVIRDDPSFARGAGDAQGLTRTGVIVTSVIRTIQETAAHSSLQTTREEVDQSGSSRPPGAKRYPLERQPHVDEED